MVAYIVARGTITDPDGYATYTADVPAVVQQYGGRFLARGGRMIAFEGSAPGGRIVIIEFPDMAAAQAFYASPEYQVLKTRREPFASIEFVAVEGV